MNLDESVFIENELRYLRGVIRGNRSQRVVLWSSKGSAGATTPEQWTAWSEGRVTASPRGDTEGQR